MLYQQNMNIHQWKGYIEGSELPQMQGQMAKETHLRFEPRAGVPTGQWKIDGTGENILEVRYGCVS